jgi:hypothetical protein
MLSYVGIKSKGNAVETRDYAENPRVSENDIVSVFSALSCCFVSHINIFL